MPPISPLRLYQLKQELVADCHRIAADLGCDLEGEMIRRGMCSARQARYAAQGEVPRVSLARLLDFTFSLRESVWDQLADLADSYEAYAGGDASFPGDDEIPY